MTGHHQGPKQKLRAGYRVPSLKRMSYLCGALLCVHVILFIKDLLPICCTSGYLHRRMWYRVLSLRYVHAMHVFDVRVSSSCPRLPLCQISFLSCPHCRASSRRKIAYSITYSLTNDSVTHPAYLIYWEPKLLLQNKCILQAYNGNRFSNPDAHVSQTLKQ